MARIGLDSAEIREESRKLKRVDSSHAIPLFLISLMLIGLLMSSRSVAPEVYAQGPQQWYVKPSYPDYALSGMPDFDERQSNWWWRSWAYPDAVAVWQHFDDYYNDWDIYYSIYTDPNIWWTIGTNYTRPIISDSPVKMNFLPGDDKQPAISWYSSNYAIAVWQHWMGSDWDIWYSVFTPNIGWSPPGPIATNQGYNDYDPAIAFDTNGWAACVWVHGNQPAATNIYYSIWNPGTMSWVGPNTFLNAGNHGPGKAAMPEIDVDSNHKLVTIWTDTAGVAGTEGVYFSWAAFNPPALPAWNAPAIVPGCPAGMNWQKGISPDTLGNNLMDWGLPAPSAGQEPLYYAKFNPGGVGWNPGATQLAPPTNGEHPDLAYDSNNNAIAVYTQWPNGQIYFSYWNGINWQPVGGAFAATAGVGPGPDQWPALAFIKNNKGVLVWNAYPEPYGQGWRSEIYYSVYTGPYPTGSWTPAKKIYEPNNAGLFLTGDDYYVDIASPTGSATTPMSNPPSLEPPANPDWTYCAPVAVANSIWWFDSKFETNTLPPPKYIIDGFSLVKSYNPGGWDDHDPQNVQPFIEHLAWLMDTDGQRTKLCHYGTTVWDMEVAITQYLSWSGVNPLGDVNGDGIVDQTDVSIVQNAMGSTPGSPGWNLAADIYPETVTGPKTADNIINSNDLNLVQQNLGKSGRSFYEYTTGLYPSFYLIEEEVEKCEDVVICLGFYQNGYRDGGHFVTIAGVNSTSQPQQLLISNPIRDDFEAGLTPGRSPIPHVHMLPEPPYITHNNASLVSQDAYPALYNPTGGYWFLPGYFTDPSWEVRIEYAVITSPVHDVAVTAVKPCKRVVGQSYNCCISVNITNQAAFTETFNVVVYGNRTLPSQVIIGTQPVVNLISGENRTLKFTWTTNVPKGNYTITAFADLLDDSDPGDNTLTGGWIVVTIPGDLNGDYRVNYKDLGILAVAYGSDPTKPTTWNPYADINHDDRVNYKDLGILAVNYGKYQPP